MRNIANMINVAADHFIGIALDKGANTKEQVEQNLKEWITSLADGTQIGSILLNTNYHISHVPSKVWDTPWERLSGRKPEIIEGFSGEWWKRYIITHRAGIEPYGIAIPHIKAAGMKAFFSVRMNEYHYLRYPDGRATIWDEHPEYRIAEQEPLDYSHQEVRDYYLAYIEELCTNYEIDGIELDIWRGPDFFQRPVTQEKADILTGVVRKAREIVTRIGKEKGRNILLSARTHSYPDVALRKGWDTVAWMKEGLLDILTVCNYFIPTTCDAPVEEWIELFEKSGIKRSDYKINVGADAASSYRNWGDKALRGLLTNTKTMKGFAANFLSRGADGFYTFNVNNNDYKSPIAGRKCDWREFDTLDHALRGHRIHVLTGRGLYPGDGNTSYGVKERLATIIPEKPIELSLYTAEKPKRGTYKITVGTEQDDVELVVTINGAVCKCIGRADQSKYGSHEYSLKGTVGECAKYMQVYEAELCDVKDGINEFTIQAHEEVNFEWFQVDIENTDF